MKTALLLALILTTGCSLTDSLGFVADKGAETNDTAVTVSVFTMCQGASVGAIQRFFDTDKLRSARQEICTKLNEEAKLQTIEE